MKNVLFRPFIYVYQKLFKKPKISPAKIGDTAPDFQLKDQYNNYFSLGDHKNYKILLSFHPYPWNKLDEQQILELEANYQKFLRFNTVIVAINTSPIVVNDAWSKIRLKNLRLLSDFWPHGMVTHFYNAFRNKNGYADRTNILIDTDRKVLLKKGYKITEQPDIGQILNYLAGNQPD